ncbi:hypothetical protein Tco_0713542 [Tanacetum coccineum]
MKRQEETRQMLINKGPVELKANVRSILDIHSGDIKFCFVDMELKTMEGAAANGKGSSSSKRDTVNTGKSVAVAFLTEFQNTEANVFSYEDHSSSMKHYIVFRNAISWNVQGRWGSYCNVKPIIAILCRFVDIKVALVTSLFLFD